MCCLEASLEELKCADCWPWEKYRQDGETERSPKPGPWQYPNRNLRSHGRPGFEMRAFTKHFLSYYIIYLKININLHMFAILWILWIAKKMLCRRAMRSALLSCCLMFSSHYLLMHFRISMHLEARNCNWEPQAHCGPKGREREVALWRTFVACLIIGRSGFAKQARNLVEIAQLLIN